MLALNDSDTKRFNTAFQEIKAAIAEKRLTNLAPALPLLLRHEGKPFSLRNHAPFEPLFALEKPQKTVLKAGRQVGKSMQASAEKVILCLTRPYTNFLFVTPLKDQIQKFSNDYVRPLVDNSPLRWAMGGGSRTGSVLRIELPNESRMYFNYADLDADRIRGTSAKGGYMIDEAQDFQHGLISVVKECTSAASAASGDLGTETFSGTSKTEDTTLEKCYQDSSQAVWVTKCEACGFENLACVKDGHLLSMIGPYRDDISWERPATLCHSCRSPIRPHFGFWRHRVPKLAKSFLGLHLPQVIFPFHYADPRKWKTLLAKQSGALGYTVARFYNEVLGESYDVSTKLINAPDLRKAAVLNPNTEEEALRARRRYSLVVLAVDWGGGGEKEVSFTKLCVAGLNTRGGVDVIFGKTLHNPLDHVGETKEIRRLFDVFRCNRFAHDANGTGSVSEVLMIQGGVPVECIDPIIYSGTLNTADTFMKWSPSNNVDRGHHMLAKSKSLSFTAMAIKLGFVRTFAYDHISSEEPGLLHDWLNLSTIVVENASGANRNLVMRPATAGSDDFAHAMNFAACSLWNLTGSWPDFTSVKMSQ